MHACCGMFPSRPPVVPLPGIAVLRIPEAPPLLSVLLMFHDLYFDALVPDPGAYRVRA
jgi:hypothetical protein